MELAIPFVDPYWMDSVGDEYYTLLNLPSIAPSGWVTVTGHLSQGFNPSPIGGVCPLNYIEVTAIY